MVPTVVIHGSDGEVLAPVGRGNIFVAGKRQTIRVTAIGLNSKTPLVVRVALLGMEISTIFTKEQLGCEFPDIEAGSRIAYASEVIDALRAARKIEAAENLSMVAGNKLDMYIFIPDTFELVD